MPLFESDDFYKANTKQIKKRTICVSTENSLKDVYLYIIYFVNIVVKKVQDLIFSMVFYINAEWLIHTSELINPQELSVVTPIFGKWRKLTLI